MLIGIDRILIILNISCPYYLRSSYFLCRIINNEYNRVCRQRIINCWYQLQKFFMSAVWVDILRYISNFDSYQFLSRKNDLNRFKYSSRTSEIYNTPRENKFHRSSIEIKLEIQKILLNNRGKYNLNHKKLIYFW